MADRVGLKVAVVIILALLGATACAVVQSPFPRSDPPFPPPAKPLPITAFAVRFTPAGGQTYPPTTASEIELYKIVLNVGSRPPQVRRDQRPTRPYVTIGKLRFAENWYTDKNVEELRERHVPAVGGNAVLTWTIYQTGAAFLERVGNFYYATYEAEIIRYTDR